MVIWVVLPELFTQILPKQQSPIDSESAGLLLVVLYITSRMLFEVLGDSASLVSIGCRDVAI